MFIVLFTVQSWFYIPAITVTPNVLIQLLILASKAILMLQFKIHCIQILGLISHETAPSCICGSPKQKMSILYFPHISKFKVGDTSELIEGVAQMQILPATTVFFLINHLAL